MSQAQLLPTASPFQFKGFPIRTQVEDDQIWFAAKDVCAALGITWTGHSLSAIPDAWQRVVKLTTLRRGVQGLRVISEPALYKLAFRSNKPEADVFTNWVASEVLPAIRKTGKYEAAPKKKSLGRGIKPLPPSYSEQAAQSALSAYNNLALPELFADDISDKEQGKRLKRVLRDLHAMQEKCGGLIDEIRICLSPKGRKFFLPADLDNTYKTLQHLNFSATAGVYMTRQALMSAYHIGRGVEFC